MDKQKNQSFAPPAVGGMSLLVVFAVLCLTIFALLSLTTVQADTRLADASVKAVSDYYAADCAAQEILARLRAGELPEGVSVYGDLYSYACPISDTQNLEVEVLLSAGEYHIRRWQAVPAEEWVSDDSLELWDGGMFF